jgi:4-hydroxy 2-oxovalerate aldolase
MNLKIIDCTIRDGGLLNNWEFDEKIVKASYFAAEKSNIDYFEIGYKNNSERKGLGNFGYCDDQYLFSFFKKRPENLKVLCMIDAGRYIGYEIPDCLPEKTLIKGLRVASYPYEIKKAIGMIESFKEKGYEVFLQLMTFSEWSDEEFKILADWKNKNILNAIYFADSFGSFLPSDIKNCVIKLKELGFSSIGFHPHNSLQMAFANTLEAINSGMSYIDATIYGMGRGSGNLPVEVLLSYLNKTGARKYNVVPYLDVIERFYVDFFKKYQWGYSLKSLFGGIKNIHPYYITEMFNQGYFTADEIWNQLDHIKESCPISFSKDELSSALEKRFYDPTAIDAKETVARVEKENKIIPSLDSFHLDELTLKDRHKNKNFIIIANGSSIEKYEKKIKNFINKNNLISIGCNYLKKLYNPDYHIFVSKKRFLKYAPSINEKSSLIVPTFFGKTMVAENYEKQTEYIEIIPSENLSLPPVEGIIQQQVYLNVAVAAILTAYQMGAKEIFVVGMDGYENEHPDKPFYFYNEDDQPDDRVTASIKYKDFALELERVNSFLAEHGVSFSVITPTSHKKYYKNIL